MTLETETIRIARKCYVNCRSLRKATDEMIKKGYAVSYGTLKDWNKRYKWEEFLEKYDERERKHDELVLEFNKEIVIELIEEKDSIKEALKEKPENPQLRHAYMNVVKMILQAQGKKEIDRESIYDEVIQEILRDPVAGKVVQARKNVILKRLRKRFKE